MKYKQIMILISSSCICLGLLSVTSGASAVTIKALQEAHSNVDSSITDEKETSKFLPLSSSEVTEISSSPIIQNSSEQEMTVNDFNLSKSKNIKSTNHADNLSSEREKSFWGYVAIASNLLIGSLLIITKKYRDKK